MYERYGSILAVNEHVSTLDTVVHVAWQRSSADVPVSADTDAAIASARQR